MLTFLTLKRTTTIKFKGKIHPTTSHGGPEGEYKYSSTLSLNLALDGVGVQRHGPAALNLGKTGGTLLQEAGWAPGSFWTGVDVALTGIRFPDGRIIASRYTD